MGLEPSIPTQFNVTYHVCALPCDYNLQAATALRLAYHDAGTYSAVARNGGTNASIRFELDRGENFGLKRGWRIIETVRAWTHVNATCTQQPTHCPTICSSPAFVGDLDKLHCW